MKKLFLLLTLSLLFFNVTDSISAENCEKQSSVYTDGKGNNRTKKLGGNYMGISLASLNEKQTIKINPVSGTFKYVTLHARYKGGYWKTIYKGANKSFPVAKVLSSYKKDKTCTHVNISVNGSHEKYEPIPCKAEVLVCEKSEGILPQGCSTFATVYTDGKGNNRTKKLGGNYTGISLASLNEKQTIKINPVSGTFKYVTLHARYKGGYWKTIYKGANKSFPVAKFLSSYKKDKNCTHVNISVNGSHEKYEPIPCKAAILVCGAGTPGRKPGKNVSKGKPVKQSSTGFGGDAKRAVDGNTDGAYGANSTTHTNSQHKAWWEVDLQSTYALKMINVYNRIDCCGDRLNGFQVIVSMQPFPNRPLNVREIRHLQHRNVKQAGKVSRIALGNALGRYVRIQLMGTNYLSLAEVEVLSGKATPSMINVKNSSKAFPPKANVKNVSKGKPVKQSSTGFGGDAKRAVDGNTDGIYGANSTTHTNFQQKAWWEVDLQLAYTLQNINVYNRLDCCGERLNGFQVIISSIPFPNRALNDGEVSGLKHWDVNGSGKIHRINLNNTVGRYVRVQLKGQNYLSLAEVQVFGKQ